jgi:hypothetical protein
MKKLFSFLTIACMAFTSAAPVDAQQSMFTRVFFDNSGSAQAWASMKTFDHNYLLGGYKDMAPMVLKMDTTGTILWARKFGESGDITALAPTSDSCFIAGGRLYDLVSLDYHFFCMKINSDGDTLWTFFRNMGGTEHFTSIQETYDGGYILAGNTFSAGAPYYQGHLVKLSHTGAYEWSKTLTDGTFSTHIFSVRELADHTLILTGSRGTLNGSESQMLLMHLTSSGSILWGKVLDMTTSGPSEGYDVIAGPDGLIFFFFSYADGLKIMKTDLSGTFRWCTIVDMYANGNEMTRPKFHRTSDGGFVFVDGSTMGPGWLMKTDSLGTPLWEQSLFMNTINVQEAWDGGYLAIGNGPVIGVVMTQTTNPQIGIIKTDSAGNSVSCVYPNGTGSSTETLTLTTYPFTLTETGTALTLHPIVTDAILSANYGCVAFLGAVAESPKEEDALRVYPNPSTGIFSLELNSGTISRIEVFNTLGQVVISTSDPAAVLFPIDLRSSPDGIYYLNAYSHNRIYSEKIIIRHH